MGVDDTSSIRSTLLGFYFRNFDISVTVNKTYKGIDGHGEETIAV